ncbi:ABC transporter permease [Legionella sp. CNM-4043-24]|uniref:ABC transporter permease n=1 Tax=Legionella sp. CNM-4043-24 TaxID=3421646 RepID=UPI00403A9E8B
MYPFYHVGLYVTRLLRSIGLFFVFFGHLCHSVLISMSGQLSITWNHIWRVLFHSGVALVLPLAFISSLMTVSVTVSTYLILSRFNLQQKNLSIVQDIMTVDLLPVLIGFVLCIQSSLSLINARIKITRRQQSPEEVILAFVIPIMIGISITALLLYTYVLAAIFLSLYLTFDYLYLLTTHEFILQMSQSISLEEILFSVFKTLLFGLIVSLTAGYYYYQVAVYQITMRRGVSRILTRGLLWLLLSSVLLKLITI